MNKNVFLLALVILATAFTANAQVLNKNTTFKLGGLGRSVLTNDRLSGPRMDGDTTSANKGLGGYTMFDLNMDLTVNQIFNANVIMRIKNPYGSFYGQDTYFEFRQLQFNGRIGRNLRYELGDIYVGLTPYTVHNANEPLDSKYEADVFKVRRDILNYENFYVGNKWRLQGVKLTYGLDSVLAFDRVGIQAFGVRTNATNEGLVPDRILFGGRLDFEKNNKLKLGLNGVTFTDLAVTTPTGNPITQTELHNSVFTFDGAYTLQNDAFLLGLAVETGMSSTKYADNFNKVENDFSDFFYQPELTVGFKPAKVALNAGYRNVGPQFNSPTAQTQRVNSDYSPSIFSDVDDNTPNSREQMLFDRTTEEGVYNRSISQQLQGFMPQYGNITPYGQATPNRTGISVGLATDTSLHYVTITANMDMLTEINGELTSELRKFTGIRGGALVNVGELAKLNRLIDVSVGVKTESTKRDGGLAVDFKSTVIDAGLSIETLKNVDFIGGVKMLTAKGNEFRVTRNVINEIQPLDISSASQVYLYDGAENIYSAGLRFRFAEFAQASVVYNMTSVVRNNSVNADYNYNQLFMNFVLKF